MKLGFATPLRKDLMGFTDPRAVILGVDKVAHSGTFVLSAPILDRDGEVVRPDGCLKRLGSYKRNPIVLYDHEGMPIGLSQSPAGALAVRLEGGNLVGTCWYHLRTKLSKEIWELVSAEPPIIRMASVGYIPHEVRPIDSRVLRPDGRGGIKARSGFEYLDWELTEWSNTPIGANQEALRIDIKSLSETVRKSFTLCMGSPMKTRYAKASYSKKQAAAKFRAQAGVDPAEWAIGETAKSYTFRRKSEKPDEDEEETPGDDKPPDKPAEDKKPDEKPPGKADDKPKDDDGSQKPSAQGLKDLYNHHTGLAEYAKTMTATNEHPGFLKMLAEDGEHSAARAEQIKAAAKEFHPDLDFEKFCKAEAPPPDDKPTQDEDDDALDDFDDEEPDKAGKGLNGAVTKRYRMKSAHQGVVKDAHEFLDDMGGNEGVPKSLRGGCKFHAGELVKILEGNADENPRGELESDKEEDAEVEKALQGAILKIA